MHAGHHEYAALLTEKITLRIKFNIESRCGWWGVEVFDFFPMLIEGASHIMVFGRTYWHALISEPWVGEIGYGPPCGDHPGMEFRIIMAITELVARRCSVPTVRGAQHVPNLVSERFSSTDNDIAACGDLTPCTRVGRIQRYHVGQKLIAPALHLIIQVSTRRPEVPELLYTGLVAFLVIRLHEPRNTDSNGYIRVEHHLIGIVHDTG